MYCHRRARQMRFAGGSNLTIAKDLATSSFLPWEDANILAVEINAARTLKTNTLIPREQEPPAPSLGLWLSVTFAGYPD